MISMKGDKRASGKGMVASSTIKQFLSENASNCVVYVSISKQSALRLESEIGNKDQLTTFSANESDDAEAYIQPL